MTLDGSSRTASRPGGAPVAVRGAWHPVPARDLTTWNERLLTTDASLFQYPYWNEPLRHLHFEPRYLVYGEPNAPSAFLCVLELGPPGLRVALAPRAPVMLGGESRLPEGSTSALLRWSRRRGHLFLRLTHEREAVLAEWAAVPGAVRRDPFPFYVEPQEELLVDQAGPDEQVTAAFQPVARRNLRKAREVGYRIQSDGSPELLERVWPLFEDLSRRKNIRYRRRESFLDLLRHAAPYAAARTFVAWLGDSPIQAILVVRDGPTAHYIIGALDTAALGEHESPSVLLHWTAMRHFAAAGTRYYDLGTRSGPVYAFKQKFRPQHRQLAPPVALISNPVRFRCWSLMAETGLRRVWPRLKRLLPR